MSDLGAMPANVLIARSELGIEEQELVLERLDLRVLELDDETARIKAEQATHGAAAKDADDDSKITGATPIEVRRATITAREHRLVVNRLNVRLLEIADERRQVTVDVAASRAHIANLRAEISQQQTRLNGQEPANV